MWTVRCERVEDTQALGRSLGEVAGAETIVALLGPLGAGKTVFTQGLALGLGVQDMVSSPTFVILCEYEGRLRLLHGDLYRVEPDELVGIGFEETVAGWPGVVAIEWAGRGEDALPSDRLEVVFARPDVQVTATGPRHTAILEAWRNRHAG